MNYNNAKVYNADIQTDDCGFRVKTDIAIAALPCGNTQSAPKSPSGDMAHFTQTFAPDQIYQDQSTR